MADEPPYVSFLIRELTEHLPANTAAAKLLRIVFDDGTGDTDTAVGKQNTIGAVFDLIYALRGLVGGSNLTMATARILGRTSGGTGAIESLTIGNGLGLSAGELAAEVSTAQMTAAIAAAVTALFKVKGSTDCSGNPNYPAAVKGEAYRVSVAGKIGGTAGIVVSVSDWYVCLADNAGGNQATVGASWDVWEGNIPGITASGLALIQAASYAAMRALLDLEVGTDFNAFRAELDRISLGASSLASAATIDLATATGDAITITGSTGPVTALGTLPAGIRRLLVFASTPTLTHNGTSLILPGAGNIVVQAGDLAEFMSLGSANWICIRYQRATGAALVSGAAGFEIVGITADYQSYIVSHLGIPDGTIPRGAEITGT